MGLATSSYRSVRSRPLGFEPRDGETNGQGNGSPSPPQPQLAGGTVGTASAVDTP
jgi:hypothetical protein